VREVAGLWKDLWPRRPDGFKGDRVIQNDYVNKSISNCEAPSAGCTTGADECELGDGRPNDNRGGGLCVQTGVCVVCAVRGVLPLIDFWSAQRFDDALK